MTNIQRQLFRHVSSSIFIRMISAPIWLIHSQGITYSVSLPRNQHSFPGPGTMRASTVPVRQSISRSLTQPRERQVQILITSFRFRSHKRMTASGTGISFRLSYASERETVTDISIDSHPMIRYTLTKRVRFRRVSGGGSI